MSFNQEQGRVEYTASAAQTVFPFSFKIFANTDLKVYKTALGQTADDATDIILLTTDYTVIVNGDLGGTMTLNSGATIGDSITIVRDLSITRPVEYQTNGDLLATTLNEDQEYQTYLTADQQDKNALHVTLQESSQGVSNTLPSPDALKVVGWNSQANALENFSVGDDDVFINILNVDAISDLDAVNILLYSTVNVKGYSVPNDGGGDIFNYNASQSAVNNGGTIINGWVRQNTGAINAKWFGANNTRTDNNIPIQNAVNAISRGVIEIDAGDYGFSGTVLIQNKQISISGSGSTTTVINRTTDAIAFKVAGTQSSFIGLSATGINKMAINGNDAFLTDSIQVIYLARGYFSDLVINHSGGNGIYLRSAQDMVFSNCYTRFCGNQVNGTAGLFMDEFNTGEGATSIDNVNDNEFIGCTFEHDTGQLLISTGINNNSNAFIGCKFEYGITASTSIPIVLANCSRFDFIACRFTHYNAATSMFDISASFAIKIHGECYNDSFTASFANIVSSNAIDINIVGRKCGDIFDTLSTNISRKILDQEIIFGVQYIFDEVPPNSAIDITRIHFKAEGAVIVADTLAPTGQTIQGDQNDFKKVLNVNFTKSEKNGAATVYYLAKSTTSKSYEIRARKDGVGAYNVIIETKTIGTSYAWHKTTIPRDFLKSNSRFIINNTSGQTGINLSVAAMYYENKAYSASSPTTGTWEVSELVYRITPVAGGNIGWVCTVSGTPGTFKEFGTIEV